MVYEGGAVVKLIIGGAYQGKRQYASEHYGDELLVLDFHLKVLAWLKEDIDPVLHFKNNLSEYQDKVILCDDISCGVVPVDPLMRKWREALGYILTLIAKESDEVIRVLCGIGMKLK